MDTSFLPDRDREAEEALERERLRQEWLEKQERMKKETIEITYSYWDGTGHRKTVECQKGDDIAAFLGKCRTQFPELRGVSVDSLMYIKVRLVPKSLDMQLKRHGVLGGPDHPARERHLWMTSVFCADAAAALYLLRLHHQQSPWQIGPAVPL